MNESEVSSSVLPNADERLRRLYALVEADLTDVDDVLKERIGGLEGDGDAARAALDRARRSTQQGSRHSDVLEQVIAANGAALPRVRSFVRKWRPVGSPNSLHNHMIIEDFVRIWVGDC